MNKLEKNKNSNEIIKIKKDKEYTSANRVCKFLQKSIKNFFRNNAFAAQVIEKKSSVRMKNQSRKDVLKTKKEIC